MITTKLCEPRPYPGHAPRRTPEKKLIEWVEGSLRRLKMDYVDNLFVHALGERRTDGHRAAPRPRHDGCGRGAEEAGQGEAPGLLVARPLQAARLPALRHRERQVRRDHAPYNLYKWPGLDDVLKLAQAKNVGVIAMKTLRGGKQAEEKGVLPKGNFAHNAFKWVWSNPAVNGLVVTIRTIPQLESYAQASGGKLAMNETESLTRMAALTSSSVCRIGCGDCLDRCSKGVQIPTVFRQDMYYTEYAGEAGRARAEYGQLAALGGVGSRLRQLHRSELSRRLHLRHSDPAGPAGSAPPPRLDGRCSSRSAAEAVDGAAAGERARRAEPERSLLREDSARGRKPPDAVPAAAEGSGSGRWGLEDGGRGVHPVEAAAHAQWAGHAVALVDHVEPTIGPNRQPQRQHAHVLEEGAETTGDGEGDHEISRRRLDRIDQEREVRVRKYLTYIGPAGPERVGWIVGGGIDDALLERAGIFGWSERWWWCR